MNTTIMLSSLLLLLTLASCATANGDYALTQTAASIGCSKKNTRIDKKTWEHNKMQGVATYTAYCNKVKFRCNLQAPYEYTCKKSID